MTKIQILGRVLPSAAQINVRMPELEWKWEERRVNLKFRVNISNSVVNVECELEEYKPEFFVEIYKRALDLSRAAVNVVAFAVAIGVTVILETLIGPDGIPSAILLTDPGVVSLVTAYNLDPAGNPEQSAVYEIIVKEAPLMRALNDLIEAITVPHIAPVNCGRVIDAIRRMISPKGDVSDRQAWAAMHGVLNISRDYQQWISEQAKGPRHGDPAFVPGDVTVEITHRTWVVMNRFLEYRKRGNQPLTAPDFPLLSEGNRS